ncbi:MAG TPA: hypothetical protein VIG71_04945 [Enteractinococcus sp.]
MAPLDTKTPTPPATALVLMLTGTGALFMVVGVIALVATNPVNWLGVGLAWFVGVYAIILAQLVKRRRQRSK